MPEYPDFSAYGYRIETILGQNPAGGRVTYLASRDDSHPFVVIKQYRFPKTRANGRDFPTHTSESEILRSLESEQIPRYLDRFDTPNGFCLVQEYKNVPSLEHSRVYTPAEIKTIGLAILDALIYLQQQVPPVIHGDLKPENILIDPGDPGKIYLVDFGFARVGSGDFIYSRAIKGTVGFMPPEEMFNRVLTKASDLYSLGVTLICLLTGTRSRSIGEMIEERTYQLRYKNRLPPKLNRRFIQWLDRAIACRADDRYPDALTARRTLESIPITGNLAVFEPFSRISRFRLPIGLGGVGMLTLAWSCGFAIGPARAPDRGAEVGYDGTVVKKVRSDRLDIPALHHLDYRPYLDEGGNLPDEWQGKIGVYAIFDAENQLRFVGYSRDVYSSLKQHLARQPGACYRLKIHTVERPSRSLLEEIRQAWIQENGGIEEDEKGWTEPIDARRAMTEAEREMYERADEIERGKLLKNLARRVENEIQEELQKRGVKTEIRFNPKLKERGLLDLK